MIFKGIIVLFHILVVFCVKKATSTIIRAIYSPWQPDLVWNDDGWANKCDFPGNDYKTAFLRGFDCQQLCLETAECTHFTFNSFNEICLLKSGKIEKEQAKYLDINGQICGIINPEKKSKNQNGLVNGSSN